MHIPDGYLSPATAGTLYAAAAPFWFIASRKTKALLSGRLVPTMALLSAFCFVIQMINIPLPGGTTGHAVGASLAAIVLSPWPAVIAVSIALVIQAFFFGDGGITAIGANCWNMAIVQVFATYYIYRIIPGGKWVAAVAAYIAVNVSGLFAAVELGLQPLLAQAPDGTPLYAPYPLSITLPAVVGAHLLAGLVEAIVTVGALAFLRRSAPELLTPLTMQTSVQDSFWTRIRLAWIVIAVLIFITPVGLLAPGTAWGEWSATQLHDAGLGFIPQGMQKWENFWQAAFADYSIPGLGEQTGYAVSAILGISFILLVTYGLSFLAKRSASKT